MSLFSSKTQIEINKTMLEKNKANKIEKKQEIRKLQCHKPFNDQCSYHIETSQLICRANQLTGFYMMGTLVVEGLIKSPLCLFTPMQPPFSRRVSD